MPYPDGIGAEDTQLPSGPRRSSSATGRAHLNLGSLEVPRTLRSYVAPLVELLRLDCRNFMQLVDIARNGRAGWGGRIRTCEWRYQKPLPYHLATPQRGATLVGRKGSGKSTKQSKCCLPRQRVAAIHRDAGFRSVAQPGRALSSGGRGRRFESCHSDQPIPSPPIPPPRPAAIRRSKSGFARLPSLSARNPRAARQA